MSTVAPGSGCDVVIVGGGLVGLSFARALANTPLRLCLVESNPAPAPSAPDHDDRNTALSPSSRQIFSALGCWQEIAAGAAPITEIHVSDQGGFGRACMRADDEGMDALGHVVPNCLLGEVLAEAVSGQRNLETRQPADVAAIQDAGDHISLSVREADTTRLVHARLVVVADGSRSSLRERLGIAVTERDYGQTGIIANVTPERSPQGRAFERFTARGPLAMLPLPGGDCSLVWTVRSSESERLMGLSDQAFLDELQQAFGFRLGRLLRAGRRSAWPLRLLRSRERRKGRALLIGNAARTLHPVAGQGFNLALRDVAELAERLHDAAVIGDDPAAEHVMARFLAARKADERRTINFTDGLVRLFSNRLPGMVFGRNMGLMAVELFPAGRRWFMRQAMGRGARPSRLARGLPLADPRDGRTHE